jgi:hypothetical protein
LIQRKTQNPDYWGDEFGITPDDLQYLSNLLVEDELPRSAEEMGQTLIANRVRREEALIERALSLGALYQPQRSYEVGERVVFPALGYRVGEVVSLRPGHNPEYGAFKVIQVRFDNGKQREFAAEFTRDHLLNQESAARSMEEGILSTEALQEQYRTQVSAALEKRLESEPDFVRLAGKWFRRDLLVDIHAGHLNLAEAVLDVSGGGPLPTEALLGDLELPEEIVPQLRIFSLNFALQEDSRFDEVGPAGEVLWFLRRMEPEGVQSAPTHLSCRPLTYDPASLTSEMLALERTLGDEWSNLSPNPVEDPTQPVTMVLLYPHWKSGTLPLSAHLAHVFPTGRTHRIRFLFVDEETGQEMPGWVVREGRYVYGLKEWYRQYDVPVGAYLELARGKRPGTVSIRRRSRRPRREWIRVALPVQGRLMFEMRKKMVSCEYDELMIIAEEEHESLDAVWEYTYTRRVALASLVSDIFPELAKLSPQGNVHAATLYSAVNLAMRTTPGPMLAELVNSGAYSPMGDNYWVLRVVDL